ncbi:MAG TPA: DUF1800 domain-containing protein [Candidatus Acidoferrales bacterium]|jgi:uncharacterized protein (DUF1800 family)|nr:DUF1800 domain-containing protein [Candidatus Acidoferrales bacterium]
MAAHLLNRAGFGGPPAAIQNLADMSQVEALSSLLDYEKIPDATPAPVWAHPEPDRLAELRKINQTATPEEKRQANQNENRMQYERVIELRGWWLNRMATGPRPFQEKMTLFWHGHFATSVEKVHDAYYMWRQNELFRRLATDNWLRLLIETGKDPAMLVWLDQAESRKEHANENFAREVMELFALGIGNYTEKDVTEGARALTGWSLDRQEQRFIYRPNFHDDGIKTFLGLTGNLTGEDVLAQIVAQPHSAIFITGKIWNFFAGQMPSPELNQALAATFRANGNDFKPFLRVMFSSEEFYSPDIVRNAVKSPTQWLVGTSRMLESQLPPPLVSMAMLRSLGQDLFAPPNVKGWDGGLSWITTNTLLSRYNEAATLVTGSFAPLQGADFSLKGNGQNKKNPKAGQRMEKLAQRIHIGGVDVDKILTPEQRQDKDAIVAAVERRLLQTDLSSDQESALRGFLDSRTQLTDADILTVIRLVMATPAYQIT